MSLLRQTQRLEPYRESGMSKKQKIVETAKVLNDEAERLIIDPTELNCGRCYNIEVNKNAVKKILSLIKRGSIKKLEKAAEVGVRGITYTPFDVSSQANFMRYTFRRTNDFSDTLDPLAFAQPGCLEDFQIRAGLRDVGRFPFFTCKDKGVWEAIRDKVPYLVELIAEAQRVRDNALFIGDRILQSDRIFQAYIREDGEIYTLLRQKDFGRQLKLQDLVDDPKVREALEGQRLPTDIRTINRIKRLTYLVKEAERSFEVGQVAKGMIGVYDNYSRILDTMRELREIKALGF